MLDSECGGNESFFMNDNRLGGLALILGALSGIITLTFHPGGGEHRVTPSQFETLIAVAIGIHAFAITGLPVSFAGALGLTRRIQSPIAVFGLIVYGFGCASVMTAAAFSGLVTPFLLRQLVSHTASADQWHPFLHYNHAINQAFAQIGAVAFSLAILLWSLVSLNNRTLPMGLAVYGLVSALATVIAIATGFLTLELHGFRVVTLTQAIWFIFAGVVLWRAVRAETRPDRLGSSV